MKRRPLLFFAAWGLLLASQGVAQQKSLPPPKTPPPQLGAAVLGETVGEGKKLHVKIHHFSQYTVPETVLENGVPKEKYTSTWVSGLEERDVSSSSYLVMTVSGQKLDDAAITKLFTENHATLVISHGKRIDPNYAAVFKPDTPIVYLRPGALAQRALAGAKVTSLVRPADVFVSQEVPQPAPAALPPVASPAPGQPVQIEPMSPLQVNGMVAKGKLLVVDYAWRQFSQWKRVQAQEGQDATCVSELVFAPTLLESEFSLSNCQVIGHDGQPVLGVDLAKRLATSTPILWLQEGMTLDRTFCQFLKPDALLVTTPTPPVRKYEGSLSCAPCLDVCNAQAEGNMITLAKTVTEECVRKVPYSEIVNGVERTRYREVHETASKPVYMQVDLSGFDAVDGQGKLLTAEQVQKRLATPTPILICEWPVLDPMQFKLLRPETIILKRKPEKNQMPPATSPAAPST